MEERESFQTLRCLTDNGDSDFRHFSQGSPLGSAMAGIADVMSLDPFRLLLELFLYGNALRSGLQCYLTLLLRVGGGGSLSAS